MPVQTKKKKRVKRVPITRFLPSLHFAWDYLEEEDKRAIEEIVRKYEGLSDMLDRPIIPPVG